MLATLLLVALLAGGCDKVPDLPELELAADNPVRMLVVNEGLFTTNTSALSAIYDDGTVYWDVFEPINQRPLGDVAQSITEINGYYFMAINNSRRVEVIDANTFGAVASLRYTQSGSPRYITPLTDSTALVSDLYGQLVRISTVAPFEILEYIPLPTPSKGIEQMVTVSGKVLGVYLDHGVAIFDADKIRISEMRLLEKIKIPWEMGGCRPLVDHRGRVWFTNRMDRGVRLSAVDPVSEAVVDVVEIPFDANGAIVGMPNYNKVDIDPTGHRIYINLYHTDDTGDRLQVVYTVDTDNHRLRKYMELPGVKMMYGMSVSPEGDVCICDCLDYSAQRGYVRVFGKEGGAAKSYKVGVYPNFVYFPRAEEGR